MKKYEKTKTMENLKYFGPSLSLNLWRSILEICINNFSLTGSLVDVYKESRAQCESILLENFASKKYRSKRAPVGPSLFFWSKVNFWATLPGSRQLFTCNMKIFGGRIYPRFLSFIERFWNLWLPKLRTE